MTDTVVQSFCERCGKRHSVQVRAVEKQEAPPSVLGRFKRKSREREAPAADILLPSGEDDGGTVHFCLECRRYSCTDCWNDEAGLCLSCRPLGAAPVPSTSPASVAWGSPTSAEAGWAKGADGAARTTGVELDEWGRPRPATQAREEAVDEPSASPVAAAPVATIFGPVDDPDPWRGVVFSAEDEKKARPATPPGPAPVEPEPVVASATAFTATPPVPPAPPAAPEPVSAVMTAPGATDTEPEDPFEAMRARLAHVGQVEAPSSPGQDQAEAPWPDEPGVDAAELHGVDLEASGLPVSLTELDSHVDAARWARASSVAVGRGSLLPSYPEPETEPSDGQAADAAESGATQAEPSETIKVSLTVTTPADATEQEVAEETAIASVSQDEVPEATAIGSVDTDEVPEAPPVNELVEATPEIAEPEPVVPEIAEPEPVVPEIAEPVAQPGPVPQPALPELGPVPPPARPIAPNMPPPSLDVWNTNPEPGPFAQPYQAPAPLPPAPAVMASAPPGQPAVSPSAAVPMSPPVGVPTAPPVSPAAPPPPAWAVSAAPAYAPPPPMPPAHVHPAPAPPPAPGPAVMLPPPPGLPSAAPMPPPPQAVAAPMSARGQQGPTRACPSCALPLSTKARFCRRCGAPQPA